MVGEPTGAPVGGTCSCGRCDSNTKVGKDDWTRAALEVIAAEGVGGVKVEPLANRLGITKGSFYWHFTDRQDPGSAVDGHMRAFGDASCLVDGLWVV